MVLIGLLVYRIVNVAGYAGIRSQIRLLALCLVYSMSLGYGVIYAWVRYADLNETRERVKAYVTCEVTSGVNCGSPGDLLGGGRGLGSMVRITYTHTHPQLALSAAGVYGNPRHPEPVYPA